MKAIIIVLALLIAGCNKATKTACPDKEAVKSAMKEFLPPDVKVEQISPSSEVKGICEVIFKAGVQSIIVYVDPQIQYIIVGNILSVKDKKNITSERQKQFTSVSKDILKELEAHVNVTLGEGSKYIYYISDPDCPFCKRSNPVIEEWAKKSGVQVRLILYPLPTHPQAFDKSVALICDKKGFKEYAEGYTSKNLCEDGKKKIQANLRLMEKLGVGGTPTFIGMNGKIITGLPPEEELNKLIN
ncbi:MAG: DsbC family protein [Aquificaceae bacterium]|nr:DsbC family protein [Aquificaceae bacterium]